MTTAAHRSASSRSEMLVTGEFAFSAANFREIADLVKAESGIDLAESKATLVYSRLAKRLRALGIPTFSDYCDAVRDDAAERSSMIAALTTNVTRFFREQHHFEHLRKTILEPLADAARRGNRVRLWSAACSTGQEPYSMALTVLSAIPEAAQLDVRILATDLNPHVVAHGMKGLYQKEELSDVPPESTCEVVRARRRGRSRGPENLGRGSLTGVFSRAESHGLMAFQRAVRCHFLPQRRHLLRSRYAKHDLATPDAAASRQRRALHRPFRTCFRSCISNADCRRHHQLPQERRCARMKKIRVLVVDDSSTMRGLISSALARDPEIEVVGEAADPLQARQAIKTLNPDVVTLDVEMPNMSGLEFLEKIMRLRPMPVIMVSTLTSRGAEETIKALEIGAVDCIEKPRPGNEHNFEELPFKVKIAASARVRPLLRDDNQKHAADARRSHEDYQSDGRVLAIGASTGGVEALIALLSQFPENCPPAVIAQHMPPSFTRSFASRLDRVCAAKVQEASEGAKLAPGHIYLAPGGSQHLEVAGGGTDLRCRLKSGDRVNGHCPSVDVLFELVTRSSKGHAVGVILTGMGRDGAAGLLSMRKAGAKTFGQNEFDLHRLWNAESGIRYRCGREAAAA